jgi:hypothetical protein
VEELKWIGKLYLGSGDGEGCENDVGVGVGGFEGVWGRRKISVLERLPVLHINTFCILILFQIDQTGRGI